MQKAIFKEFDLSFNRSVKERLKHGFIKTYKPVIDDSDYRSFSKMKDYRKWCSKNIPKWLGF